MEWPDADHRNMIGEVTDVLGKSGDNDVEMNTILAQYGLPYKYPEERGGGCGEDFRRDNAGGLCRTRGLPRHVHVHHRPEGRQGLRRRAVHQEAEGRSLGGGRAYRRREPLR